MNIVFFGSTTDSLIVLHKIYDLQSTIYKLVAVVTQPPKPVGRKQIITPTPVERWAKEQQLSVCYTPDVSSFSPDLLISASYGEKIPADVISAAKFGGLNVHPSLLPRWRGGDPVPWAILSGDHQTGVTVVTLANSFDAGEIIAQKKVLITPHDTTVELRPRLFTIGAELLVDILKSLPVHGTPQKKENEPYARRLVRDDGFEPWEAICNPAESERINRKYRAFHPWPGLWSIRDGKRIKILAFTHAPTIVQWEGKTPTPYLSS